MGLFHKKKSSIKELREQLHKNYEEAVKKIAQDYHDIDTFLKELERG